VAHHPTTDAFATPTPVLPQTGAQAEGDNGFFSVFLPLLFKSIFVEPLVAAYGPVLDPGQPGRVSGQVDVTLIPIVTDPPNPTPPTATPGGSPTPNATLGTPTWTPSVKDTLTPTSMPTATRQLVPGGGLEKKEDREKWLAYSWREYDLFFKNGDLPQAPGGAFEGEWYMWLGGAGKSQNSAIGEKEIAYVERQFTFPDPNKQQYRRYYLGHQIRFQSYDSVCSTEKYSSMTTLARDEMLAGLLRHATPAMIDQFNVDLGGMIMCVNKSGRSGCSPENVEDLSGGRKAVYVAYYDLCKIGGGTSWSLFLFPIAFSPELAGKSVTVQIKVISDRELSSSVLVDNVAYWFGPPLPTPTPRARTMDDPQPQTESNVVVLNPILAPDTPPSPPGVQIIYPDTKEAVFGLEANSTWIK
jgi:hypothetical protein